MPETLESIDAQIAQLEGQLAQAQQGGEAPDYSAFFKSPGYQFRQDEGIRAIDRSASARGQLMSGGTLRELQRYGQGLASSEFGNYANRLSTLAGIGQTSAFQSGQIGSAAAGQVGSQTNALGQTILAGGQAQAEGIIGGSNAMLGGIGGAIGQFGNAVQQYGMGSGVSSLQQGTFNDVWGSPTPYSGTDINWW